MTKYQRLVGVLVRKTNDGTAAWETTSSDDVFALSLPDYSVRISMHRNSYDGSEDVVFQIVNADGSVIDTFTDSELARDLTEKAPYYAQMQQLYQDARRKAFGVDEALDKLLAELDKS